ncbi:DUF1501 domain-containing protein [Alienimonas sp. DA493]|uniref:DUF1501 domain-containing protein n=1 Tax=Alienimonas sp. DA493 TaxID=3373605 RepID=UPI003754F593
MSALSRRQALQAFAASAAGASMSGWLPALAAAAGGAKPPRSVVLLWMTGGPSQLDTFDPKPNHENGGEFQAIDTAVPGVQIAEHLPGIAQRLDRCAVLRTLSTPEGDHGRATYLARTGYRPGGAIDYPTLGAALSKELQTQPERPENDLPGYISVAPFRLANPAAFGSGFLGPEFAPLVVGEGAGGSNGGGTELTVRNLAPPRGAGGERMQKRLELLSNFESSFARNRPDAALVGRRTAYEKAVRMMSGAAAGAFDLDEEPAALRDKYGRSPFGQGCLLARRLVERGVPFVEVSINGVAGGEVLPWDTHADNFAAVQRLCEVLDPAWSTLLDDLKDRGLGDTLVVWMGEFGRTPTINPQGGRDHFPTAWNAVMCGDGIVGGSVVGATDEAGMEVTDRPISAADFASTLCRAAGVDPWRDNLSNVGRPIRLADPEANPVEEILA